MKNKDKTKKQLLNELAELRQRIAEFKISEALRKKVEDLLKKVETERKRTEEDLVQERVQYWGGDVKIHGIPNKGTTVIVSIPLDNKEGADDKNTHR